MKIDIKLLIITALAVVLFAACETSAALTITGVVREMATLYETGAPASNVEVKLYTHKEPALPQLPPLGDLIASTITDESGNYKFEIRLETLPEMGHKLVVFVDNGYMGWRTVTVDEGTIRADLAKGSIPLP